MPILKGGIYRQVGDYFIPNLILPDDSDYQIGKYGRLRRNYLKEHRKILYTNYVVEGTLFKHLFEIDQACNERMEIIVPAMAKQEGVTEALKAADQMEWVRRKNSIHSRAEEIVLHELVRQLQRSTWRPLDKQQSLVYQGERRRFIPFNRRRMGA